MKTFKQSLKAAEANPLLIKQLMKENIKSYGGLYSMKGSVAKTVSLLN